MAKIIRTAINNIYYGSALIVLLILWEVLPKAGIISSLYLPPLSTVLIELIHESKNGYLLLNISLSLFRVTSGLLMAAVFGIGFGLIFGYFFPTLSDKLSPLLRFFGQINPYSLFPLFIVFLGIGEKSKIAIVAWTSVWPILFHTITGTKNSEEELLKSAKSMGASHIQILQKVILPSAGASIFDGLRLGVEMAFFILIAAEMSGGTGGLGAMIHLSGMSLLIPRLFAAGLCTVVLGVIINKFFYILQQRVFFWRETTRFFKTSKPAGKQQSLGIYHFIILIGICLFILIMGAYLSHYAYQLMNDADTTGEFGSFQSE